MDRSKRGTWAGSAGTDRTDEPTWTDRKRESSGNAVIAVGWLPLRWKARFLQGGSEIRGMDGVNLFLSLLLWVKEAQYRRAD
jgi:hypothetical protein